MHVIPDNHELAAQINFEDFQKIDIRAGTVVQAELFPEARKPAIKMVVDFGSVIGLKKTSAQITENHKVEELVGRKIAAVVNFPPRQIGKFMSEVLTLGFPDKDGFVLLVTPDKNTPNGARLF
jgi:tRNA-binding protein